MRAASSSGETPSAAMTSISETRPSMPNHVWPSSNVVLSSREPPSDDSLPKVNTPETRVS